MVAKIDSQTLQWLANGCNNNTKSCKDSSLKAKIINNYNGL